jgi:ABC-type uncharacterized transport system substrate-binding protein
VITERLELLRELVPGLHRLAVIVRNDPGLDQKLQDIRSEARRKRIEPLMLEATTGKALELAFARLRGDLCEAIYVASGPLGPAKRSRIIALAEEARLPVIYSFRILNRDGSPTKSWVANKEEPGFCYISLSPRRRWRRLRAVSSCRARFHNPTSYMKLKAREPSSLTGRIT